MEINSVFTLLLALPAFLAFNINAQTAVFDITKYGATAGGDIAAALDTAWKAAIASPTASKVVIPAGSWHLSQAHLAGPAKAPVEFEVAGTVTAGLNAASLPNKEWEWVTINYIDHLTISGGGTLDGQGQDAWKKNDCGTNLNCAKNPINLSLNFITNSLIHNVTIKDSKNFNVNCISSKNVTFKNFHVSCPGDSLNTDGIHIARSSGITVIDSTIATGDDCISIGDDSTDYHIENVVCGPGHGISIGSLGKNPDEKDVARISVLKCTFKGTTNGIRIKTWPSAPAVLSISDLRFEDLTMDNVANPIIIDQEYCPYNMCNKANPSKIQINKVSIKNVKGSSSTAEAVTLACSSGKPCEGIEIGDIDLTYSGPTGPIKTICNNVKPILVGKQNPPLCATPPAAAAA